VQSLRTYLVFLIMVTSLFGQTEGIQTDLPCQTCHTGGNWKAGTADKFDHSSTSFLLEGTHADLTCSQCHEGSSLTEKHQFDRLEGECSSCHEDVHNNEWGSDCQRCHTPETWTLDSRQMNHDLTRFPLQGPHRSLSCESCHLASQPAGQSLPVDCWGCHKQDYRNSLNPRHSILVLDTDCERCHSPSESRWQQSTFDHAAAGWQLTGMHAQASCESCHTQDVTTAVINCASCHLPDYEASQDPAHASSGYPLNCMRCHDSFSWNTSWTHARTGFPLEGEHEDLNCSQCHVNQNFSDTPESCSSCHLSAYESSQAPPHNDAGFGLECARCHSASGWRPSSWLHEIDAQYPLLGGHDGVSCTDCHQSAPYSAQSSACYACHQADYEASTDPNHIEGNIPTSCEVCHTSLNWETEEIDHSITQFPLEGAHVEVECETCHAESYDLEFTCDACHQGDYDATVEGRGPDHGYYEFSISCEECHTQSVWVPSFFDHDPSLTTYELTGKHLELLPEDCESCHVDAIWADTPIECQNCHQSDYQESSEPDHQAVGFPENLCESCHTPEGWDPSIFDHELDVNPCATCHLVNYNGASEPLHEEAGFDTQCESCHTSTAWVPGLWDHGSETDFDPRGAHIEIPCSACHATAPWEDLGTDCASCHQSNFDETDDPDHGASGFPISLCESCHSQDSWEPAIFSHESATESCVTCHQLQYDNTTEPPHETLEYPLECETCHSTESWSPSTFEHNVENTGFLLDGAHETVVCSSCHENYQVPAEIRTCASASCHATDYDESSEPPHASMNFSTDCTDCHTTTAWSPALFEHTLAATGFALEGAHANTDCQQCHEPWQILPEPRTCAASTCHLTDYNNTSDPDHQSASFPLECETCHTQTGWTPASFDHDSENFPIYSGQHRGEWNDCSQCHINSSDFGEFTCFGAGCHSISEMNNEHCEGTNCESCNGFTYPSTGVTPEDCLTCHPNGDEDDCDGGDRRRIPRFKPSSLPSTKGPDERN
jgi:hypothetical protein